MTIATSALIRWTGLAAVGAGLIFAGIQPVHPPDVTASVGTTLWVTIMSLKLGMCLLFLVGLTGLYARQAERVGWLGLAGFCLLVLSWWLQTGYVFAELLILPVLAPVAPQFVDSFLGIVNGTPGEMAIGALPGVYGVVGLCYLLGGVLFGVAMVRAKVLPLVPSVLFAVAALITPAAALLPHALQRYAAIPMGIAMICLGYVLWSERAALRRQGAAA
jgi:hypothetical protein